MIVEIISVGTEILIGDILNTNTKMLSTYLNEIGLSVCYHTTVGDNPQRLFDVLNIAKKRADIIITTGGLGPTYDDLTKEIVSKTFDKELVFDGRAYKNITDYFENIKLKITQNQRKQALIPNGSIVFYNENGTAPGVGFFAENTHVLMLPGPPRECEPMFVKSAIPYLRTLTQDTIFSVNLKIFGLGEAFVEEKLYSIMTESENPSVAPYASEGECRVRITAKANSLHDVKAQILPIKQEIYNILGDVIYGEDDDTLESVVANLLLTKNKTISFAESCTGGFLSKRLTDIPNISSCFKGSVCSYSNEVKQNVLGVSKDTLEKFGAVSKECSIEMAEGVKKLLNTDISVAITGIAGPTGQTKDKPLGLCFITICTDNYTETVEITGYVNRNRTRINACNTAFNMIRKLLI